MMIWQKLLMGEDGGPATVDFIGSTTNTADQSSYTFTATAIGGPGLVVVAAHGENGSGGNLSGLTLNGNAMTAVINALEGGRIAVGLYSYRIVSGTTADIVVSFTATMNRAVIGVWRLQGLLSDTAYDTAGINGSGSVSLDGLEGGVGIAATTDNDDERVTWTGMTERYDVGIESGSGASGGDTTFSTDETGRTVSTGGDAADRATAAASWR